MKQITVYSLEDTARLGLKVAEMIKPGMLLTLSGDLGAGKTTFTKYLGKGLAAVASVVDPQIFVIGGGVSKAGDILFKYIEPSYKRCAFGPCKQAKFALAELGNDAGIYGGACLILQNA